MAKKQLTPEAYKAKLEKKALKREMFSKTFISAFAAVMAVAMTFCCVLVINNHTNLYAKNMLAANANVSQSTNVGIIEPGNVSNPSDNSVNSSVDTEEPATDAPDNTTNETPDSSEKNETPDNSEKNEAPAPEEDKLGGFKSTEEVVAYFNECANKVKVDATKVVKNYEKRIVGEVKVPDLLQGMAESLLNTSMKDDNDPIVYATNAEIKENFLVPNQSYVSCLKAEYVAEVTCKDKGNEYEIYFKLKDEKNPRAGAGVASVCDVIEAYEVAEKAPSIVTDFSTNYYNCEVTATIDKETGRMTHALYSTPLTLNVAVEFLGSHSASVGFTFVKDYSITY